VSQFELAGLGTTLRVSDRRAALLACGFALALGWAYMTHPTLALLPAAVLLLVPLVLSAHARVLFFVIGTLVAFRSSDDVNLLKLGFLAGVAVAFGAALLRLSVLRETLAFQVLTPMLRASVAMFVMLGFSLPVALAFDVTKTAWLRDVSPYVLFACAPVFALEAADAFGARTLRRILVGVGAVGALSFTLRWLANRGLANLEFAQIGLPTLLLPACVFAYGLAVLLQGNERRSRWLLFTAVLMAMLLSTGTRAIAVLAFAPVAIVLAGRRGLTRRFMRLALTVPIAALLAFVLLQAVVDATDVNRQELSRRATFFIVSPTGSKDESYIDRRNQTTSSWNLWKSSRLTGVGPGHPFPWVNNRGRPQQPKTVVDSPVSYLAKFGLIGVVVLGFVVAGLLGTLRRLRLAHGGRSLTWYALVGYAGIVAGTSLLVVPFEDKGLAVALLLLLALAACEAVDANVAEQGPSFE
jgi:hypothetical protein